MQIDRSDFHAAADSAILGLVSNRGHLIGHASVNGGGDDSSSYHLRGREVAFTSLDNRLNWVQAQDSAHAEGSDFTIIADTVAFTIADDMVQGGFAWGSSVKTRAVSSTNTITADSLAIDSPNQTLEELRAFGSARAVSVQDSLDQDAVELTHVNLNDNTLEGLRHRELPAFSVQYHPEASAGPHDAEYLFDEFIHLMESK